MGRIRKVNRGKGEEEELRVDSVLGSGSEPGDGYVLVTLIPRDRDSQAGLLLSQSGGEKGSTLLRCCRH